MRAAVLLFCAGFAACAVERAGRDEFACSAGGVCPAIVLDASTRDANAFLDRGASDVSDADPAPQADATPDAGFASDAADLGINADAAPQDAVPAPDADPAPDVIAAPIDAGFGYATSNFSADRITVWSGAIDVLPGGGCVIESRMSPRLSGCGMTPPVPLFTTQDDGTPVVVVAMNSLVVQRQGANAGAVAVTGDLPLILLVRGDVLIAGAIEISASGDVPGAGARSELACGSGAGDDGANGTNAGSGGGGGAFGSPGGRGGQSGAGAAGGQAGAPIATLMFPALRGGCPGGEGGDATASGGDRGAGGGALQISSSARINISGQLLAGGGGGGGGLTAAGRGAGGGGGGSGGLILLEARILDVAANSLISTGGGGGGGGATEITPGLSGEDGGGATNAGGGMGGIVGGRGGSGAANQSAEAGEDGFGALMSSGGGGGGGGLGWIFLRGIDSCSAAGMLIGNRAGC